MPTSSTRSTVRLISFITAALLVLVAWAAVANHQRESYRRQLEGAYLRSLQDAAGLVYSISTTLEKELYAGTTPQRARLSAALWKDASAAKSALSTLPVPQLDLGDTYKFLSQVGDYSLYLTRKAEAGGEISEEEWQALLGLHTYALALKERLGAAQQRILEGGAPLAAPLAGAGAGPAAAGAQGAPQADGFLEMEDFSGYPTLIYDGPFSDHLAQREPLLTQGKAEITRQQARERAAQATGVVPENLAEAEDENSRLPSYNFSLGDLSVSITKNGGLLHYLMNGRPVGAPALGDDEARERALHYLVGLGLGSLKETYYERANNILLLNFAHFQEGTVCYTDLVKVGVALDDGEVVLFDATGYIVNHRPRQLGERALTPQQAQRGVSPRLRVLGQRPALIPTAGLEERLCYEFYCAGEEGEELLVYINADTGAEEQLLRLYRSASSVLAK